MSPDMMIAMEWGFKAHEKGMNLQMAQVEFLKLSIEDVKGPPVWRTPGLFTDEELENLTICVMEEQRDRCDKHNAHAELDGMELFELLNYIDPDQEVTEECMRAVRDGHCCLEDLESEHPEHIATAAFLKRFGMITEEGLTEAGDVYLKHLL
jgi:hypothetical protein